uniref:Uncharacterized protein n=1 Tax=Rhizophora mucronata TaxID=61149 RepID=A0A2P2LRN2_RHIMU
MGRVDCQSISISVLVLSSRNCTLYKSTASLSFSCAFFLNYLPLFCVFRSNLLYAIFSFYVVSFSFQILSSLCLS